jgi:hypothetical protein
VEAVSLPPGLWALPANLDPDVQRVLEELLAHVDLLDEKVTEAQGLANEAYGMALSQPDTWEAEQALDNLDERVGQLIGDVDALKSEIREATP